MGIIKRQGIKQSIVTYVGILIGMLNMLWIYPTFITPEQLGLIKFLQSTTLFILPFVFLGSSNLVIRFFPEFKNNEKYHHGFLPFLILLLSFGCFFFLIVAFLAQGMVESYYLEQGKTLIVQFLPHLVLLVLIASFSHLFTTYALNFKRIVVPTIFNDLFLKLALPTLVFLYYFDYLSFEGLINGLVLTYFLILLGVAGYIYYLGQFNLKPDFSLFSKPMLKRMSVYMGYGLLGSLGNKLANQIDIIMVASLVDLRFAGIYSVALTISMVIDVPRRALSKIISPILAEALKKDDRKEIKMLYQKSALNQLIVGLYIFLGIWVSVDFLFGMMSKGDEYILGKYVILFLGMSKLVDMVSGINGEIIVLSKYYRYQSFFIFCLAIFNVAANLLWIPLFQVNGAALATLSSLTLFNILKFILIKRKYDLHPFTKEVFGVCVVGLVTYGFTQIMPMTSHNFINIIINSVMVTIIYGSLILYLRLSPDINDLVEQGWQKVIKFIR